MVAEICARSCTASAADSVIHAQILIIAKPIQNGEALTVRHY